MLLVATVPAQEVSRSRPLLLTGSSLGMVLMASAAFAAAAPAPRLDEEVVITGSALTVDNSDLAKLTEPLLDTPQSFTAVSAQELLDRGINNLNDALKSVPGISLGAGEFAWQGNTPSIRGFVARNDMFLDGMRDFGNYYRDSFNLQQIEVLQGPSSVFFGRGSTGGVINQVSKQPTQVQSIYASGAIGTDGTYRAVADVGGPLDSLGTGGAVRLTAMAHRSGVAGRDFAENTRFGVAPSLALGLGTPTRLTVGYFHQSEDNKPDYGMPWYLGRPAPVPRNNFYGFRDDFLKTGVNVGTARVEHTMNESLTLRGQVRYAHYDRDFRIAEAVIPAGTPSSTPLPSIMLSRNMWSGDSVETALVGQLDAVANFTTGFVDHSLVVGGEIGRESSAPNYYNSLGVPQVNMLQPGPLQNFSAANTFRRVKADTKGDTISLYGVDTLKFGEQWDLSLGARWDSFDAVSDGVTFSANGTSSSTARYETSDAIPSYRAALVYKPVPEGTLYGAFGTSFNPSAEGLSFIVAARNPSGVGNINLDPEENQSFEFGSKWEILDRRLTATGAIFRLEKLNARVPDPNNSGFNMLGGRHRVDGFQAQIIGQATPDWFVSAGYTYLDGRVAKSAPGAAPVGRQLVNTPEHSFNFFTEYKLIGAFEIGFGGQYQSSRLGQNTGAVPLVAADFWTFEAVARYTIGENFLVQLNVYNLADTYYIEQLHPFHVVPGAGRSALLTAKLYY